jgi:hypothetical protein
MVKTPSRFNYGPISNLAMKYLIYDETARALHEVSLAWSLKVKKNIVGIGMVETRSCTRFDLSQI